MYDIVLYLIGILYLLLKPLFFLKYYADLTLRG